LNKACVWLLDSTSTRLPVICSVAKRVKDFEDLNSGECRKIAVWNWTEQFSDLVRQQVSVSRPSITSPGLFVCAQRHRRPSLDSTCVPPSHPQVAIHVCGGGRTRLVVSPTFALIPSLIGRVIGSGETFGVFGTNGSAYSPLIATTDTGLPLRPSSPVKLFPQKVKTKILLDAT